ncbi:hypothetical protein Bbelb_082670 [Branchiostoma belcheri]|nr:hypothetical protein Bbelb_082670 [Branchiostoma belcheri]
MSTARTDGDSSPVVFFTLLAPHPDGILNQGPKFPGGVQLMKPLETVLGLLRSVAAAATQEELDTSLLDLQQSAIWKENGNFMSNGRMQFGFNSTPGGTMRHIRLEMSDNLLPRQPALVLLLAGTNNVHSATATQCKHGGVQTTPALCLSTVPHKQGFRTETTACISVKMQVYHRRLLQLMENSRHQENGLHWSCTESDLPRIDGDSSSVVFCTLLTPHPDGILNKGPKFPTGVQLMKPMLPTCCSATFTGRRHLPVTSGPHLFTKRVGSRAHMRANFKVKLDLDTYNPQRQGTNNVHSATTTHVDIEEFRHLLRPA